jgi:hypothetical protein
MMYGSFLRAEQEYYSDKLRERGITECEWHEGRPKFECPECDAAYDAYQEMLGDMDREERACRSAE